MKKLLFALIMILFSGTAFAAMTNLTKPGTNWVWRVDDGLRVADGFLLNEDSTKFITEDSFWLRQEAPEYSYLYLESGVRMLSERDEIILTDEYNQSNYGMVYGALRAQGWQPTDSDANVPQGWTGSQKAVNLLFGLMEDGSFFVTENSTNLKLEN